MSRRQVAPGVWVDEEPGFAATRAGGFYGRQIADMQPVVEGTVLSKNRDKSYGRRQAYSIRPENRYAAPLRPDGNDKPPHRPRTTEPCNAFMPIVKQPCARTTRHTGDHRTVVTLENARLRKMARYPRRVA